MLSQETRVISTTSARTDGSLSVSHDAVGGTRTDRVSAGNYDVNELWYEYEAKKKSDRAVKVTEEAMAVEA